MTKTERAARPVKGLGCWLIYLFSPRGKNGKLKKRKLKEKKVVGGKKCLLVRKKNFSEVNGLKALRENSYL